MPGTQFYEFGPFRLDSGRRLLFRQGEVIPLSSKVLETLTVLVENRGRVMSKEDLIKRIWPDTFVEEGNLTQNISTLRKVLGESPTDHAYIGTIPKQGYKFVAEVREGEFGTQVHRHRPMFWVAALLMVLGFAGSALWLFSDRSRLPVSSPATNPLTSHPGLEFQPSFSPEGTRVAFAWNGEKQDNVDVYVRLVGTGKPLRLTTDPARDFRPVWSPDGRHIAFLRETGVRRAAVLVIPAIGGLERRVAEAGFSPFTASEPYLEWTPDGKWLATTGQSSGEPMALFLISTETGEKRRLTFPLARGIGDANAAFSPDGRTLAFSRLTSECNFCLLTLGSGYEPKGEPSCFVLKDMWVSSLIWTPKGREVIFSAPGRGRGRSNLWRMEVSGRGDRPGTPKRLPIGAENSADPAISRDGRQLAFSSLHYTSSVWRLKLAQGSKRVAGESDRLTKWIASTHLDSRGQYSPDGSRILFISTRSGRSAVWVCASDGSDPVQLTFFDASVTGAPSWSPDGQRIVFDSNVGGQFNVYVINADGGGLRRLTHGPGALASWSRDGKSIYFQSRLAGQFQIWKMPSDGTRPAVQLTKNGGSVALESLDGMSVYYSKYGGPGGGLWRMPAAGGDETKILNSVMGFSFTLTETGIYFVSPTDRNTLIQYFDFATRKTKTITEVGGPLNHGLSVSPDRRFLLFSRFEPLGSDLMIVENFR